MLGKVAGSYGSYIITMWDIQAIRSDFYTNSAAFDSFLDDHRFLLLGENTGVYK